MNIVLKSKPSWLLALLLFVCFSVPASGRAQQVKALHYLRAGQPDVVELLPPPPLPDSAEQAADMASVVAVCHGCSTNDAALALAEKKFSVANFAPALGECAQPGKLPKTDALLEHTQKDAAAVVDAAKDYWKRPRPFTINPSLASGKLEKSFGYPSGHATEGMAVALVLAELFPNQREAVLAIGRNLGWHRVCLGRHYPTDIYAGRVVARAIVREMKTNPEFQRDFAQAKAEISTLARTEAAPSQIAVPAAPAR